MRVALNVLIGSLIVSHLLFFVLEAILWQSDVTAKIRHDDLGFTSKDQTEVAKVAVNQGASNAFLAAGLVWGLLALRIGRPEGRPILHLFLGFIAVAGLVGYFSILPPKLVGMAGFLVGQTGLAIAALVCLCLQSSDLIKAN